MGAWEPAAVSPISPHAEKALQALGPPGGQPGPRDSRPQGTGSPRRLQRPLQPGTLGPTTGQGPSDPGLSSAHQRAQNYL